VSANGRFGLATEEYGGLWAAVDVLTGEKLMCGFSSVGCARRFLEDLGYEFLGVRRFGSYEIL
jgi:hypothetical protein